ncbi:hypothetical protein LCGC14_0972590 [marine sediment metagenome]|uniref:Bacteriophage lambda Replication protein O N-terminal domain-containing protein n=1 Tax=marine sediment metagenome TaxID=412755 RepID=A0A0F9NFR2_9ZZZZ
MADKRESKTNGATKKGAGIWQADWMTKVLANGHNPQAKLVFMRIASFGERGCWMINETFQDEFNRSDRTIRRAITSLFEKGDIIVTGWNGHGRKMYAAGHPKVKDELNRGYFEARKKGKVKTNEEYLAKIRLRTRIDNP